MIKNLEKFAIICYYIYKDLTRSAVCAQIIRRVTENMLEQVLEEIKLAEEIAATVRREADEYAAAKNKDAEAFAANSLKQAEETAKNMKKEYKASILREEDKLYNEVLSSAKNDSDALYNSLTEKINALSDEIVGKVLNGDC